MPSEPVTICLAGFRPRRGRRAVCLVADARDTATRDRVTTLVQRVEQAANWPRMIRSYWTSWWTFGWPRPMTRPDRTLTPPMPMPFAKLGSTWTAFHRPTGDEYQIPSCVGRVSAAGRLDHWAVVPHCPPQAGGGLHAGQRCPRRRSRPPARPPAGVMVTGDSKAQLEALRRLAKQADPETWPVKSLRPTGNALGKAGDLGAAVAICAHSIAASRGGLGQL